MLKVSFARSESAGDKTADESGIKPNWYRIFLKRATKGYVR